MTLALNSAFTQTLSTRRHGPGVRAVQRRGSTSQFTSYLCSSRPRPHAHTHTLLPLGRPSVSSSAVFYVPVIARTRRTLSPGALFAPSSSTAIPLPVAAISERLLHRRHITTECPCCACRDAITPTAKSRTTSGHCICRFPSLAVPRVLLTSSHFTSCIPNAPLVSVFIVL